MFWGVSKSGLAIVEVMLLERCYLTLSRPVFLLAPVIIGKREQAPHERFNSTRRPDIIGIDELPVLWAIQPLACGIKRRRANPVVYFVDQVSYRHRPQGVSTQQEFICRQPMSAGKGHEFHETRYGQL